VVATGNMDVVATLHFKGCPTPACDIEVMAAVLACVVELPPRMAAMAAWLVVPSDATSGGLYVVRSFMTCHRIASPAFAQFHWFRMLNA